MPDHPIVLEPPLQGYRLVPVPDGRPPALALHLLRTLEQEPGPRAGTRGNESGPAAGSDAATECSETDDERSVANFTNWLLARMTEVLRGRRPAGQLTDQLAAFPYAELSRRARLIAGTRRDPGPLVVRSVRRQFVRPDAVEVAAHLRAGTGSVAVALRLERGTSSWICTALDFGPRDLFLTPAAPGSDARGAPVPSAPPPISVAADQRRRAADPSRAHVDAGRRSISSPRSGRGTS